jgi:hypothetical protein
VLNKSQQDWDHQPGQQDSCNKSFVTAVFVRHMYTRNDGKEEAQARNHEKYLE